MPTSRLQPLRRLVGLARPYRTRLALALALSLVSAGIGLVVPLGLRALLDSVFVAGRADRLDAIAGGLLALFLVSGALGFAGGYLIEWTGERVVTDLRQRLYRHLVGLDLGFFARTRTGDLTSRLTSDVGAVRSAVTSSLVELVTQSLSLVGSVALMVTLNARLSLAIFAVVPLVALLARAAGVRVRALSRSVQDALATATAGAEEAISGIRSVQAFGREPHEASRYAAATERVFGVARHAALVTNGFWTLVGTLFLASLVGIFWFGGREVMAERLTAGALVAFIFYAFGIARSVGGLARLYTSFATAIGASGRLFELLDTAPAVADAPDAIRLPMPVRGAVALDGVSFGYAVEPGEPSSQNGGAPNGGAPNGGVRGASAASGERHRVLDGVTLSAAPGETVALVGPSGAGKSTLLALLPRFFDVDAGRVTVDGHDVRALTLDSLRGALASVPQDVHLFATTIRENIRYGRLDATDAEVENAARRAHADAFIRGLPGGYDAEVGERGVRLSGGERQRVAIARALLRDAPILLLDEATSALDAASERAVQDALDGLMQGRTTFVIAHRLATVVRADRIVVLDRGRVVETGTHADLVARGGLYASLAALQFGADVGRAPTLAPAVP